MLKRILITIFLLCSFSVGAQELPKLTLGQALDKAKGFAQVEKEFVGHCKNYSYTVEYSSKLQQWEVFFKPESDNEKGLIPTYCPLIIVQLDKDGNLIEKL